jgi:hypothetical protein
LSKKSFHFITTNSSREKKLSFFNFFNKNIITTPLSFNSKGNFLYNKKSKFSVLDDIKNTKNKNKGNENYEDTKNYFNNLNKGKNQNKSIEFKDINLNYIQDIGNEYEKDEEDGNKIFNKLYKFL